MLEEIRQAAMAVTSRVFETMFFVALDAADDNLEEPPAATSSPVLRGEIGFQGAVSGKMVLSLPYALARPMAMNFLGLEEEEVSDGQVTDMVSELCNMIGGNVFSEFDKKTSCVLGIPSTEWGPLREGGAKQKWDIAIGFEAEDQWVKLAFHFEPPVGSGPLRSRDSVA